MHKYFASVLWLFLESDENLNISFLELPVIFMSLESRPLSDLKYASRLSRYSDMMQMLVATGRRNKVNPFCQFYVDDNGTFYKMVGRDGQEDIYVSA